MGRSEADTFWTTFLRSPMKRGLEGVKLVVADAHERAEVGNARVLGATWQRCKVHSPRNALAHVGKAQQSRASAARRQAFWQPDQTVPGRLGTTSPTSSVNADPISPHSWTTASIRARLHRIPSAAKDQAALANSLERLNKDVKRRADVVGLSPSKTSIISPIVAPTAPG
ncbi:transposase [Belnapia sp. T18]|uniref:Mutator family transposase n=1 Tax=Belnapia arida TaxID=2804533 RepID=A0ABS1UDF6_9PROT|nr:transposase [Belnapia arida]MBL6082728.1 transposase [Belnapia arida]